MKIIIGILFLICTFANPFAQTDRSAALYKTIKAKDSILFAIGFDKLEVKSFEDVLSNNFEFYHDEVGIIPSKSAFIASINDLRKMKYRPRRELIENAMEVYPLFKQNELYGAIQTGKHRFYAIEKGKPENVSSTAKFIHIWLIENGNWKLSRVLSYSHHEAVTVDTINEKLLFVDRTETDRWLIKKHIPALGIGYINDGKIHDIVVYGRDVKGRLNPDNMIFDVASLTKPITAMVALKLINEGKWSLDDPLYTYWTDPDVADDPRSKELKTRHILSHQSGLPNWRNGKLCFEFKPGSKYQYSGEGFEYLRRALENKFKKTLDQLARELIFQPLKMNDTRFYWDSTIDEARFAKRYQGNGTAYETYKYTSANGANHLLTTIEDYSKFMIHVMNGAGLDKELYRLMLSDQSRIKARKHFGLGWWIDENVNGAEDAIVHGGDDSGVHTIAFMLPKSKQGLLIFTNCDNGTDIYIPTIQHYLGKIGQGIIEVETK